MNADQELTILTAKEKEAGLSDKDVKQLETLFEDNPCHLEVTLFLLRHAWRYKHTAGVFFQDWEEYYHAALSMNCWNTEKLIRLLGLAGELYGYDEKDEKSLDCYRRAYELDPNNWGSAVWYAWALADGGKYEESISLLPHLNNFDLQTTEELQQRAGLYRKLAYWDAKFIASAEAEYKKSMNKTSWWEGGKRRQIHRQLRQIQEMKKDDN